MKRGITIIFSLLMVCLLASPAYAEKIAFVDVGKVFDGYTKTKDFDETLTAEGKKKQKERDSMVQDIRRLKDEMALLSDSAKGEKQSDIDNKIRDVISKISTLHFVATDVSNARLIQYGMDADTVFNFGCPAVEYIAKLDIGRRFDSDRLKKRLKPY